MSAVTLQLALSITREKRAYTLKARLCLLGVVMQETVDDHGNEAFLLTRGPLTREFGSLDDVEGWLNEVGH